MLKLGKKPVRLCKEVPGFLFNRLQFALYREAMHCLEKGVATAEDIDLVVKAGYGFRLATLGPLETSDFGGLDTFLRICQNLFPNLEDSQEPPRLLKKLVAEGKLGVKTGEGLYSYPKTAIKRKIRERDRRLIQLIAGCTCLLNGLMIPSGVKRQVYQWRLEDFAPGRVGSGNDS